MEANPFSNDRIPEIPNNSVATMNDQKNCSFPYPNGCLSVGTFVLVLIPISNKTWLKVSENEWYVSDHIALLFVSKAAISFAIEIPKLPNSAAYTALLELPTNSYSPFPYSIKKDSARNYLFHEDILIKFGKFTQIYVVTFRHYFLKHFARSRFNPPFFTKR